MAYRCSLLKQRVGVIALRHDLLPLQEVGLRHLHTHQIPSLLYLVVRFLECIHVGVGDGGWGWEQMGCHCSLYLSFKPCDVADKLPICIVEAASLVSHLLELVYLLCQRSPQLNLQVRLRH